MTEMLDHLPDAKRGILLILKERGSVTITDLAKQLSLTREGVRLALSQMTEEGWLREDPDPSTGPGRPAHRYRLTAAGEHLFPKAYDALAVELVDRLAEGLGEDALREVLARMTDARARRWEPVVRGKSLRERLELLKGIYIEDDPFMSVEEADGDVRLVERNCPFMNVASRRPALCSVTVSLLSRLLGHEVERVESFQAGHGRCAFRLRRDKPVDERTYRFQLEPPPVSA
jgi:predicted ArsR family transcriptional regulator